MPVYNSDVAKIFEKVADLLEIEGANQFRVRAYRDAARTIRSLSRSLTDLVEEGEDLTELSGIGKDLAGKIQEIVETGELDQLERLTRQTPADLAKMLEISGLGPKRVQSIHDELGVSNLKELRAAASEGRIQELDGLGPKTESKILQELEKRNGEQQRTLLAVAEEFTGPLVEYLQEEAVERVEVAGSYRRRKETVGDLDILVVSDQGEKAAEHFVNFEDVAEVVSQGETRASVVLRSGLQVDLRVVADESYGAALMYFTGSKAHNISLRETAVEKGLKINEYGVFPADGGQEQDDAIAGESEEEMYRLFDLPFIVPELREDRGELDAAREDRLPELITLDDLKGDLQTHTRASDGRNTLREMAEAAREIGYEYLALTDHTAYLGVTQGLEGDQVLERMEEIQALDEELEDIHLIKSMEVDILEDGSLDLPEDVLEKLDLVVGSIHSHFNLSREEQTERVLKAMDHPQFTILGHPTGRRIHEREPYPLDLEAVIDGALARGCFLEINAHPSRLDLKDTHCQLAVEKGLRLAVSTDAHSVDELRLMTYGVDQARRGWVTPDDVINTRSWKDFKQLISR
jgi:DNA polymerase (family 10)